MVLSGLVLVILRLLLGLLLLLLLLMLLSLVSDRHCSFDDRILHQEYFEVFGAKIG